MRMFLSLLMLVAFAGASTAGPIRKGVTLQVKAESIWFQDAGRLAHWQALKQSGDAAALASYQDGLLQRRDAWQFLNTLDVRIRGHRPKAHQVDVEMISAGRMQGSRWVVDEDALKR